MLAMPSTALAVKRVLYKSDYLGNQYQASLNETYERPSKLFRVHSVQIVCRKEVYMSAIEEYPFTRDFFDRGAQHLPTAFLPTP